MPQHLVQHLDVPHAAVGEPRVEGRAPLLLLVLGILALWELTTGGSASAP